MSRNGKLHRTITHSPAITTIKYQATCSHIMFQCQKKILFRMNIIGESIIMSDIVPINQQI